jgi:ABC-type transporter Mla maintaining outer membrane lipid asymmetry ATPase subunit MlaF
MIECRGVRTEGFDDLTFRAAPGAVTAVITASDDERRELMETLIGLCPPRSGEVLVLGEDVYGHGEAATLRLMERVGVVWSGGGAISNLNVCENITLPLWYHRGMPPGTARDGVRALLAEAGLRDERAREFLLSRPGELAEHELRLLSLVRALLMEPEAVVCESVFEGLAPGFADAFARMLDGYRAGRDGRTVLHLSSDEASLAPARPAMTLTQRGREIRA